MSRKRTKQYLMLLMVVGLVSIAAGGGGTFASFSAETSNNGNYFATGTLILNNNGGTTTCTSAADSGNLNTGAGNGCDTLFDVKSTGLNLPYAVITTTINSGDTGVVTLDFTGGLIENPIVTGDSITIDDGAGNTDTLVAASDAAVGDTSVTVQAFTASNTYLANTAFIRDTTPTYYAKLTLTNAGTIDATGISFDRSSGSCSTTYQLPTGSLTGSLGTSPVTQIPVASVSGGVDGGYRDGDPVIVTHTSPAHVQTFTADGDQTATDISSNGYILVASETPNYSGYTTGDAVGGPSFGTPTANLCTGLKLSIIEESDSTFASPVGCAFGTPSGSTCDVSTGTPLGSVPSSLSALNLTSDAGDGNTGVLLNKHGARYFLLALKVPDVSAFGNSEQNRATSAFDLTWHIDQA